MGKALKQNLDFIALALVIAGFVFVAAQQLGEVPLPDSDEAMTLQVPYEILNHGKLAFPMYRFLGGNIENSWHSFTPVFFVMLSGFLKVFGWGLLQARAFNLIAAAGVLLMVYLIARKLIDWRAGMIAVVLLISDPLFLSRSRVARNDMIAAGFGLLAFYLYERAEDKRGQWIYVLSGLAAGAGVMCHTNLIYILTVIVALMLLRDGWSVLKKEKPYLFAAGAASVMAYEIIYDLIDYQNFVLQNRRDAIHFRVLEPLGWWHNLTAEPLRYSRWLSARGVKIPIGTTLIWVFLSLTAAALVYLLVRFVARIKQQGNVMKDGRARVFAATVIVMLVFGVVTQRKITQYVVHLAPWFALCVGIMLMDAMGWIRSLGKRPGVGYKAIQGAVAVLAAIGFFAYGSLLVKQNQRFLEQVRDPDRATYEPFKAALRSIVPDSVCPMSLASAHLWLAFPERDQCYFAQMESRVDEPVVLEGKEYALIAHPRFEARLRKLTGAGFDRYHLLGELWKTPYGSLSIYYTGTDPRYLTQTPRRYYFFGRERGVVSEEQLAGGREVWTAEVSELSSATLNAGLGTTQDEVAAESSSKNERSAKVTSLASLELEANKIYQVITSGLDSREYELAVLNDRTGAVIQRFAGGKRERLGQFQGLFKTSGCNRIRLAIRMSAPDPAEPQPLGRISIREISPI